MSYGNKHYDELFAGIDAQAREAKTLPEIRISGEDRTRIVASIRESIDVHMRQHGSTKIFREKAQIDDVIRALDRSLSVMTKPEKPS